MKYNLYFYKKGDKPVTVMDAFLDYAIAFKYAKTYSEDLNSDKAYVQLRELDDSPIGKLVFDSRKQTIVDNCGRYEIKDKSAKTVRETYFENSPREHSEEDLKRHSKEELDDMDFLEDLARAEEAIWEDSEK